MNEYIEAVQLKRSGALHRQIYGHMRELISSGKLTPGERVPSTQELARVFAADVSTVHAALTPLVKEGLIERVPKRGTFVRQREEKLTCVAVLNRVGISDSLYSQAVHKALQEELRQAGIEMNVWSESRPEEEFAKPWQSFVNAATHREFQAVIVTSTSHLQLPWQTKLPVATVFHGSMGFANSVNFDFEQFAELSVQALAQQRCRSVGLIAALPAGCPGFYGRLIDRIGDRGLTVKNEWMRVSPPEMAGDVMTQERFGHEEFLRLWAQPERPDGLIVYPDTMARGVILGLLDQQVPVPQDLKLVLHKNEAVDLYCPLPVTFAVSSEREVARALIEQVQKQFRGEACEPVNVPFRQVAHSGSSQRRTNEQPNRERNQL